MPLLALLVFLLSASPALALPTMTNDDDLAILTTPSSSLGQSVRRGIVGGANVVDRLDMQWGRFSDRLRGDGKTCDPVTNRRRFDNGVRRDGTPIGNPVLGALCTPEPLLELNGDVTQEILQWGNEAAVTSLPRSSRTSDAAVQAQQQQVRELVGPAFSRAQVSIDEQATRRQDFNRDLYAQMRAFAEVLLSGDPAAPNTLERQWGKLMLDSWAPHANRNDFKSPFPTPDSADEQPYNEGALLDALGRVSVALEKLQTSGVIGHWEISIPEDDYWNVVTIAVDDDVTLGGQILARERGQLLPGSPVGALARAAMENNNKNSISYTMTTYFIDPTTTKQEMYNPTQLLISLNDLGQ